METLSPFAQVAAFAAERRGESLTGSLLGLSLPERDAVLAAHFEAFDTAVTDARADAVELGRSVDVDGSTVSLTDGGDTWTAWPDGRLTRSLSRHEGFDAFVQQLAAPPEIVFSRPIARAQILAAAYQAFWSPSATNWQPTRVVELVGAARDHLAALVDWPTPPDGFPLLLLLRRDHYESLLGDVLEPFGQEVTAREESIDAGIFAHTLAMGALAQGLTVREHVFSETQREAVRPLALEVLLGLLEEPAGEGPADPAVRASLQQVHAFLGSGKYHPDALLAIGHPVEAVTPFPSFGTLVSEHSTQRVASPAGEYGHDAMMRIWDVSLASLPAAERGHVRFADFSWHEQVPSRIGKAMFDALYGVGADLGSKAGGVGGLLTKVTARNYLLHAAKTSGDALDAQLPTGWRDLDDDALRKLAKDVPFRRADLGRYMLERILRDGKYVVDGEIIVDDKGRPLSVPLLVRMFKSLASTFGNFFLKFQNTHPQNAVLLADATAADPHQVWRSVGKVAATLTWLSRAEGASSIIKTGPIDLARDPIGQILAENPDGLPHLKPWQDDLAARRWLPAMTFQVGLPLAGTDIIEPGTPNEHTGYEERRRDKRPPRETFEGHYFPAP